MGDRQEFAGINDPRQHLIDLGVDAGFVDMVKTILEHASQFDEIGIVIRSGIVNTGLGGSQITSPIVRVLYTNDPLVRSYLRERVAGYQLPEEIVDTYFQAEQSGAIAILYRHPKAKEQFGTELLTQFLKDANEAAFQFLRSYFGFTE